MSAGMTASGSRPIWASRASRRGDADASTSLGREVAWLIAAVARAAEPRVGSLETIGDAALGQIIGRHFDEDLVSRQHADAVLAHFSGGMRDDLMIVLKLHAKRRIGQ